MGELLAELARRLVDEPDAVRVEQVEGDDGSLVLRLHVAEDDVGKVIGRQGRIARAQLTVGVAADPVSAAAERTQAVDRLLRKRPGGDVAPDDDRGVVRNGAQNRIERIEIPVHVVERRDAHRR